MHESASSWQVLQERCFAVPACLRGMSIAPLERVVPVLQAASATVVTGLGASEGPARLLASGLAGRNHWARFIPLSGLIAGDHDQRTGGKPNSVLVVFSQALSPNARIALEAGRDFSATILICGSDESIHAASRLNLHTIQHPPEKEQGFLVRMTGPAVASAVALGLAALITTEATGAEVRDEWLKCADAMEMRLGARPPEMNLLERQPAFLVYGTDGVERNHLLRWTLLECMDKYDPPVWDVMAFAHGAFQNMFEGTQTMILLRSLEDVALLPLLERLRDMLRQTRHTLIDVPSELPRPWCMLEHLATVQAFLLEHLQRNPRDLENWPGRGRDEAIYGLTALPTGELGSK